MREQPVARRAGEGVVPVVPGLAHAERGQDAQVAAVVVGRERPAAEGVAQRVDAPRHVVEDEDPHEPCPQQRAERGAEAAAEEPAQAKWQAQRHDAPQREQRVHDPHAMRIMNSLFPLWCVVSLGLPFGLGWLLGGSLGTALSALVWAGLVRVFVLHHVTWSVNSLCHTFGRRPFTTNDDSTNLGVLAALSMGESWHNGHHAFPRSAATGCSRISGTRRPA